LHRAVKSLAQVGGQENRKSGSNATDRMDRIFQAMGGQEKGKIDT
jgi:hypothetical protein